MERQRARRLGAGVAAQNRKKLALPFGVLPLSLHQTEVVAPGSCRQPDFVQRLLKVNHNLATVLKNQRHHATHPLVIDVARAAVVDPVARQFDRAQQVLGLVHEVGVCLGWAHYNLPMLKYLKNLTLLSTLCVGLVHLSGCGQTGPLYLPGDKPSAGLAACPSPSLPSSLATASRYIA